MRRLRQYPLWARRLFVIWLGLTALCAIVLVVARPAHASRCPYGQILRVSMGKCVSWHSKLAYGYVHVSRARTRVAIRLPAAKPQPIDRPEIEVLRERLAHPAPLTATDILLSRAAALVQ